MDDILFRIWRASLAAAWAPNAFWQFHKNTGDLNAMAYVFESVPADRGLIDMDDPREINWWRKQFGCSEQQLRRAVQKVGNSAAKVEQVLDGKEIVSV